MTAIYYNCVRHLVVISKSTQRDVMKVSGRSSTVIYNSVKTNVNIDKHNTVIKELEGKKYILDVNSFITYKNTERLIEAFSYIKDQIPHYLYLKGRSADDERKVVLMRYATQLNVGCRVLFDTENRSDEEMESLYDGADLFVSPSLLEGFGLTPIEAALHRIPVIVSNINTLIEVIDGKLKTFNPRSVKDISDSILFNIQHPQKMSELEEIAQYFEKKYSSEKQIKAYVEYFDRILT